MVVKLFGQGATNLFFIKLQAKCIYNRKTMGKFQQVKLSLKTL